MFGIPVCKWGMKDTVEYLSQVVASGTPHQIITANPIMIMTALENPEYKQMMQAAELIVPDGSGVVWAAQKGGEPVAERVAGIDLMHELLLQGAGRKWRVYLMGSTAEVIEETAHRLSQQYPGLVIVGYRDGYFGPEQDEEVVQAIKETAPHLLFVARGADTQEPWIAKYKKSLGVPIMMGVGGSFDVISGKTKRAPLVFQKLRLEWLYRLLKQPSRLPRMLALPKFTVKVMREGENLTKVR
jgi:N-acetylglucosaminyldiphosphoundecaprenol N-acetyl-beta-D-mannosaminyltransferase